MTTLSDLVSGQTKAGVLDKLIALLRLANFPTASWQPFSLSVHLTDTFASVFADATELIASIAKGGFLDLAEDSWLTLLAKSLYNEDRKAAVATRGAVTLVDAASSGPHSYAAGTFWVANADGTRRFKNIDAVTIVQGGTQAGAIFEAETPGGDWNVGVGTLTQVLTPGGTGITVSNPAGADGTWITQQGVDEETDVALRQRCRDKWATIGSGSNDGAYRYWCTSTSSEVTKVALSVDEAEGVVELVIAGPLGPVSSAALTAVQAAVAAKKPLGVQASVANATAVTTPVVGTLYLAPGAVAATAKAAVEEAITAYARTLDIGATVYVAELVAAAMGVDGVRNVVFTAPVADVSLGATQVFVPSFTLGTS